MQVKKLFCLLSLLLSSSLAQAQLANRRAEAEARSFLSPCKEVSEEQPLCRLHQRNFIEQYVYAKAGDLGAMGSTSSSFTRHPLTEDPHLFDLGSPAENLVQACAWQMARAEATRGGNGIERGTAAERCRTLNQTERLAAGERAAQLLRELRAAPASTPSGDWEPVVAGLKPSPKGAVDPKCLDRSYCPLGDDACEKRSKFAPPRACPAT